MGAPSSHLACLVALVDLAACITMDTRLREEREEFPFAQSLTGVPYHTVTLVILSSREASGIRGRDNLGKLRAH